MKWDKNLDNRLKELLQEGLKYDEISMLMNTTIKSVSNRSNKLGLKIIHHKNYICENCGKTFKDFIKANRLFCSKNCSAEYNNSKRNHSEETKNKIRDSINIFNSKKEKIIKNYKRNIKEKTIKEKNKIEYDYKKLRKCKNCGEVKIIKKRAQLCEECHSKYYKYYRPLCEFDFKRDDYQNEFDINLVKIYGWYSPTNKGNNLNGVSRDHLYSVKDGFKNNIDPYYIKHPANCQLLKHSDNNLKNINSIITINELYERIKIWDIKYEGTTRIERA